jgi:hypothetical protein
MPFRFYACLHLPQIAVGNSAEKRGLVMAAWNSRKVQDTLTSIDPCWLWNGDKIAW